MESASTVSDEDEDDDEDEEAANNRRDAMFGDDARNIEAYERSRARRREFGVSSITSRANCDILRCDRKHQRLASSQI